jgi:glycosyltransferase involved in cell wall biosynthesis
MKKEICIDARMAGSSGIGTYIRSLLAYINDAYKMRLIIGRESFLEYPELQYFDPIFSSAPIYSFQEQIELPFLIPKCDLFWSPHFNIPLFPIRAKKRLVTIHDVFFLAFSSDLHVHKRLYSRFFFKAAAKFSDHVITDSQFSQDEICKYVGNYSHKLSVIPLGVDSKAFDQPRFCQMEIPSKYILYVGNLVPHKNICRLIQSLDLLPEDIHLVLVGKETKWNDWHPELKKREGRITMCGKVSQEQLIWLYQNAQMLVHPSYYEGFGLTPLEAMSSGCPVVVSKAASLPEVCGDAVIYVDPFCIQSIAEGIMSIWNKPLIRTELKEKGFQRAGLFNWNTAAQKHVEIIERVLR